MPKGFVQYEIIEIIEGLLSCGKVVCFEVVEINPSLDNKGNKMAEAAFEIIERITPFVQHFAVNHDLD